MDKPDVRALAEDVPADVRALARKTWEEAPVAKCHADVEAMIAGAIMADRRATRETAKAEGRRQGLEEAAKVADDFARKAAEHQKIADAGDDDFEEEKEHHFRCAGLLMARTIRAIAQKAEG